MNATQMTEDKWQSKDLTISRSYYHRDMWLVEKHNADGTWSWWNVHASYDTMIARHKPN